MILFGHTHARVKAIEGDPYPSWVPYCIGYAASYVSGALSAALLMSALAHPPSAAAAHAAASGCGSLHLGCYAGSNRTYIRNKYGIRGSACLDVLAHTLVSPCALCQEAEEVEFRASRGAEVLYGQLTPMEPHEPFSK